MGEEWYVSVDGDNRIGPVDKEQVVQMIKDGKLGPEMLCQREGREKWAALRTVQEFSEAFPQPTPRADRAAAEKARAAWSALKSAICKSADELGKRAGRIRLRLKVSSIERKRDRVFLKMGKALYEKGEELLADESYKKLTEELRSMEAEIGELRDRIREL